MEFECQTTTEVALSKNLPSNLILVDNTCIQQFESNQIQSCDSLEISTEIIKIDESENSKPKSGLVVSSLSVKDSPAGNHVLSSFVGSITDLPPTIISEILNCLDPKELGLVSCVSSLLYRLASEHHVWKEFYSERWGLPIVPMPLGSGSSNERSWKDLFVEREFRSRTFMGRYTMDALFGHTDAVRALFLLSSKKLLFTSGYDSTVRMWDVEEGLLIASSHPLGSTIRAVAADINVLVVGGTDGFIHGWKAEEGFPHLFNLRGFQNHNNEFRLWEHEGPITSLALDRTRIYSGSWDMTVRVWDRSLLKCLQVLRHSDWVWSIVPHDTTLASASGSDVCVWDTDTGIQIGGISNARVGNIYSLARSHTGNFLFTGGEDGGIRMFELSGCHTESNIKQVATWIPHSGPVYSLAFEFPWLVSSSSDGRLSLIDVRKLLKVRRRSSLEKSARTNCLDDKSVEPPQRMLHGFGCNLFAVDIGSDRIICGGEEGVVRIWNFSQALEIERRSSALKSIRLENRMRRRKLQMQMNSKGGRTDQCSVAAKKNAINGDKNRVWHNKRAVGGKLKA